MINQVGLESLAYGSFSPKAFHLAKRKPSRRKSADSDSLGVRRSSDGRGWVFVHPRAARERAEDLDEVREMVEAGETDVAIDELRWLVEGCSEFIAAHALLGELALEEGDFALARGHFGFAVQLGLKALQRAKVNGPLPFSQPANRTFYEAGRGLVTSLAKLGMTQKAIDLVQDLVRLDPSDPLQLRALVDEVHTGGLPIVEISPTLPKQEDSP
jgi:tetratricopeptide (TPR) repeat protein